jgi:hypothetical protein
MICALAPDRSDPAFSMSVLSGTASLGIRNATHLSALMFMATREGLARLATTRCQELDGFVDGLFGEEETLGLPERAHRSRHAKRNASLDGAMVQMARDETKAPTGQNFKALCGTCER